MLRVKDKKQVYRVAINAALGSFLFGYELVNISSLQKLFQTVNSTSDQQTQLMISLITAALPLGAIVGALSLKAMMKCIKARYLMVIMDVLTILSIIIQDISLSFAPLLIGRLFLGFIVGINSGLVPQYIYSVTPTQLAGSVGSLHQVFLMVGVAISYLFGFIIVPTLKSDQIRWRIVLSLPILTCIVRSFFLLLVVPYEIPSHRMKDKQVKRLQKYYYKIYENYGGIKPQQRQEQINQQKQKEKQNAQRVRNTVVCIVLALSNQLCGINAILFYAKQLFMRVTGGNNNLSQTIMIFLGVVQIIATLISGKLMDRFPKKYFLLGGSLTMVLCLFFIFMLESSQIAVILFVFLHTIAYSFSIGQLLMYYAAKLLQNTGMVIFVNWLFTFFVALTAEFMMNGLGIGKMCLLFSCLLTACLLILAKGIPNETQMQNYSSLKQPLKIKLKPEQIQLYTSDHSTAVDEKSVQNDF